jgi:hypothetical protein
MKSWQDSFREHTCKAPSLGVVGRYSEVLVCRCHDGQIKLDRRVLTAIISSAVAKTDWAVKTVNPKNDLLSVYIVFWLNSGRPTPEDLRTEMCDNFCGS